MKTATKSGRITWKRFNRDFKFTKNHLDKNASFDDCMFETFGKEVEFVKSVDPTRVLTITDCDGQSCISPGFHIVNRLGYLVCQHPVPYDFWVCY